MSTVVVPRPQTENQSFDSTAAGAHESQVLNVSGQRTHKFMDTKIYKQLSNVARALDSSSSSPQPLSYHTSHSQQEQQQRWRMRQHASTVVAAAATSTLPMARTTTGIASRATATTMEATTAHSILLTLTSNMSCPAVDARKSTAPASAAPSPSTSILSTSPEKRLWLADTLPTAIE